jgi:hypothetical protein
MMRPVETGRPLAAADPISDEETWSVRCRGALTMTNLPLIAFAQHGSP